MAPEIDGIIEGIRNFVIFVIFQKWEGFFAETSYRIVGAWEGVTLSGYC